MIRFTCLQSRTQAAVAIGGLAVIAAILAITGPNLVHVYDTSVANCGARGDCPAAISAFLKNDRALQTVLDELVVIVPGLIGLFWGAPLVARELETGSHRLAWTQSITRTRWLAVKLGVAGLASAAVGGLLSLLVTWWSSPVDRVDMSPFVSFDQRDIVPIGYAAFAFIAGVTAGVLIRRTLPAMATTLAVFAGTRLIMAHWARPYFIGPLRITLRNTEIAATDPAAPGAGVLRPGSWILSDQTINAAGRVIGQDGQPNAGLGGNGGMLAGVGPHGVAITGAGNCPNLTFRKVRGGPSPAAANHLIQKCVDQLRIRDVLTYQPASRYWAFQWYEMAIFSGIALILGGFCFWWIRRRLS